MLQVVTGWPLAYNCGAAVLAAANDAALCTTTIILAQLNSADGQTLLEIVAAVQPLF